MTTAVCIYCGTLKHGAFNPCLDCKKIPLENEDRAKSFILTDHHHSVQFLNEVGEGIKNGANIEFSPEQMETVLGCLSLLGNIPLGPKET